LRVWLIVATLNNMIPRDSNGKFTSGERVFTKEHRENMSKANEKLKEIYSDKEIVWCEMCGTTFGLTFHHRHKRVWYKRKMKLLAEFDQTILICLKCHQRIEYNREEHHKVFNKLRGW